MVERDEIDAALRRPAYAQQLGRDLEALFEARTGAERRRQSLVVLGLLLLGVLLTLRFDADAGQWERALALKSVLVVPLFGLAMAAQARAVPGSWSGLAAALPVAATVLAMAVLAVSAPPPFADRYLMAGGVLGFSVNLVLPLRTREAVLLCGFDVAVYLGVSLGPAAGAAATGATTDLVAFFAALMVVTLRTVARRERAAKDAFLFRLRDERQTAELSGLVDELTRLAHSDALTGVGNRRSFELRFAAGWRAAEARVDPLALVMVDLDHFKLFNDTAGHAAGDACLCAVAGAIAAGAGCAPDAVSRYGGEEFAVILPPVPGGGDEEPAAVAERIRRAIEALALPHPGLGPGGRVSASVGVAAARPGRDGTTPEALREAADAALYRAKRAGRNQVALPLHLAAAA